MSVGKESIRRAAAAGAKTEEMKTAAEAPAKVEVPVKAEGEAAVKTETVKAAEAAPKAEKKAPAAKKTVAKKSVGRPRTRKTVKTSVLTPMNSEEIQRKFISDKAKESGETGKPVGISEELPVYLL